jgi:hypothetical protein
MRRMLLTLVVALLLVFTTAAPAFAFIHAFVPVEECAASEQAGENTTAASKIPRNPIATPPAPDECPAPDERPAP